MMFDFGHDPIRDVIVIAILVCVVVLSGLFLAVASVSAADEKKAEFDRKFSGNSGRRITAGERKEAILRAEIKPKGKKGSLARLASAIAAKCQQLEIDLYISDDTPVRYAEGARINSVFLPIGSLFNADLLRTSQVGGRRNIQLICNDPNIRINPDRMSFVPYSEELQGYMQFQFPRFADPGQFEPVLYEQVKESGGEAAKGMKLPVFLGRTEMGNDIVIDMVDDKWPHWVLGGATGSGKTSTQESFVISAVEHGCKLAVIDVAKRGDSFAHLGDLNNLLAPIIITEKDAYRFIKWLDEVAFPKKNLTDKNTKWIILVDEVADLVRLPAHGKKIYAHFESLLRKSRSGGVHFIFGTQALDSTIFKPQFKANVRGRICLTTTDSTHGPMILGEGSGESANCTKLLMYGDGYIVLNNKPRRFQASYVSSELMNEIINKNKRVDDNYEYPKSNEVITIEQIRNELNNIDVDTNDGDIDNNNLINNSSINNKDIIYIEQYEHYRLALSVLHKYIDNGITQRDMAKEIKRVKNITPSGNTVKNLMDKLYAAGKIGPAVKNGRREVLIDAPIDDEVELIRTTG